MWTICVDKMHRAGCTGSENFAFCLTRVTSLYAVDIFVTKRAPDLVGGIGLTVDFDVRIDEIVEGRAFLSRLQVDIAAGAELNAVLGQIAEVILLHLGK